MTTTLLTSQLSEGLAERAHLCADRLERDPFYSRLLAGRVTREEYASWLIQMHKYVRYSERMVTQLAHATAGADSGEELNLHEYALEEAQEEAAHDDLLVVDLARLWNVSRAEARGRLELAPTAPAIHTYSRLRDTFMLRYPKAILGVAFCLETVSSIHADQIRENLIRESGIEGIERATTFLRAHRAEVEEDHRSKGAERIDQIVDPQESSAVHAFGCLVLNMYEGIAFYLSRRFEADHASR